MIKLISKTHVYSLWRVSTLLLYQGFKSDYIDNAELRLVLGTWLLACLVLASCCGGSLYALMAVPNEIRIETTDALIKAINTGQLNLITQHTILNKIIKVSNTSK